MKHPAIAAEVVAMAKDDQRMRRGHFDPSIDHRNTARLKEIVAEIGWLNRSKVGDQAEHDAWLLVQHADDDPAFQRACLDLMSREPPGEVCPEHRAYLDDRLRVAEGKPQRYGTQFRDGRPAPIDDLEHLDERRASVGLGPFAEYRAGMDELARRQRRPG